MTGTTRIYTGLIILKVSAGTETLPNTMKKEEYEMRTRTRTNLTKTRSKYLHWKRYNWRHPDASGPIVCCFALIKSSSLRAASTSSINTYYVVAYTSRGKCQSEIDLRFSPHVPNAFTQSLCYFKIVDRSFRQRHHCTPCGP